MVVTTAVTLVVVELLLLLLVEALLGAVLRIIALLVVWLLLVLLRVSSILLAGLEGRGAGLERSDAGSEAALRGGGVAGVHIELLLGLAGEVLVLSGRVVLPGVEVGHGDVFWGRRVVGDESAGRSVGRLSSVGYGLEGLRT